MTNVPRVTGVLPTRRVAIAVVSAHRLAAAAVVGATGLVLPLLWWHHMADLRVYRRAAAAALRGADVYRPGSVAHPLTFTYPPFAALFATPLALVSATSASVLITVLTIAAALFVVVRMLPTARIDAVHRGVVPVLVVALMWTEPMRVTVRLGQINVILMALVVADATGLWRRFPRGVVTGIAIAVKLTPAVFVLYALTIRRARPALVAAGVFAATVGLAAILEPSSTRYWTTLLWDTNRVGEVGRYGNQSLLGVSTRLLGPGPAARVLWLAAAVAVLVVGLRLAARLHRDGNAVLAIGVAGVISSLLSPISWTHHWVWCVVVFAGLLHHGRTNGRGAYACAAAWLTVFDVGPNTPVAHLAFHWALTRDLVGNDYVLAGLLLIGVLAVRPAAAGRATVVSSGAASSLTSG